MTYIECLLSLSTFVFIWMSQGQLEETHWRGCINYNQEVNICVYAECCHYETTTVLEAYSNELGSQLSERVKECVEAMRNGSP
ncbi:hypothetical protein EV363DRAFT_1343450 [Boletus edulis]|nr:hypothetical protein EV363DRAFT_1343450 [Boletus edulis]